MCKPDCKCKPYHASRHHVCKPPPHVQAALHMQAKPCKLDRASRTCRPSRTCKPPPHVQATPQVQAAMNGKCEALG